MSKVVSIFKNKVDDEAYRKKIMLMDKMRLLAEMINYQETRQKSGRMTITMAVQGIILFSELEARATTPDMRTMASSYRSHLQHLLTGLRKNQ